MHKNGRLLLVLVTLLCVLRDTRPLTSSLSTSALPWLCYWLAAIFLPTPVTDTILEKKIAEPVARSLLATIGVLVLNTVSQLLL